MMTTPAIPEYFLPERSDTPYSTLAASQNKTYSYAQLDKLNLETTQRKSCTFHDSLITLLAILTQPEVVNPVRKDLETRLDVLLQDAKAFCDLGLQPSKTRLSFGKLRLQDDDTEYESRIKHRRTCSLEMRHALKEYSAMSNEDLRCPLFINAINSILNAFRFSNKEIGIDKALDKHEYNETTIFAGTNSPGTLYRQPDIVWMDNDTLSDTATKPRKLQWDDVHHSWKLQYRRKVPNDTLKCLKGRYSKPDFDKHHSHERDGNIGPIRVSRPRWTRAFAPFSNRTMRSKGEPINEQSAEERDSESTMNEVRDTSKYYLDEDAQCTLYGMKRLLSDPRIIRCVGFLVEDELLSMMWYDHSGCIKSSSIDIIRQLPHFVVLIVLLQRFHDSHWKSNVVEVMRDDLLDATIDGTNYKLEQPLQTNHRPVLSGRVTSTAKASEVQVDADSSCPSGKGREVFLKLSWPDDSRESEFDIVKTVKALAIEKLGIHHGLVTEHLPELYRSRDARPTANTNYIRRLLGVEVEKGNGRILRVLIAKPLQPLSTLTGDEFWKGYWDIVKCHALLWKLGIHHGDISYTNLMTDGFGGILNNVDYSNPLNDSILHVDRTDMMPFTASDLLEKWDQIGGVPRFYRHALESLAWTLVWTCCCCGKDGRVEQTQPCNKWIQRTPEDCLAFRNLVEIDAYKCLPGYAEERFFGALVGIVYWIRRFGASRLEENKRGMAKMVAKFSGNAMEDSVALCRATQEVDSVDFELSSLWNDLSDGFKEYDIGDIQTIDEHFLHILATIPNA